MAINDTETPVTYFANPYLKCSACDKRAVGFVGTPTVSVTVNLLNSPGLVEISIPTNSRNWPCYHVASRTSVCVGWTAANGCPHGSGVRAQHSDSFTFEGERK